MMIDVDRARWLVCAAACAIDSEPTEALRLARMARAVASDIGAFASSRSIQLHGGIGFTWKCDVHIYVKRQKHISIRSSAKQRVRKRLGADDATIAAAAASFGRTRALAKKIKDSLHGQRAISADCPYCGQPLGKHHADHIVPVKHGGPSEPANMVLVCARCNLAKGEQALREFLRDRNLDRDLVEASLDRLRKRF